MGHRSGGLPTDRTNRLATWLLAASLTPFFLLAGFSHPAADDFHYALRARELGFVGAERFWYVNWTGRYFATALQSGFPLAVDMLTAYPLVPLATLTGLLGALALVAFVLNGRLRSQTSEVSKTSGVSGLERGTVWLGVLGFAALYITQMPSLVEGFYWLAGAATYEQSLVLVLLLAACLVSITARTSKRGLLGRTAAATVLALAIAGSNEPVFAVADVLLLAGTVVAVRRKHPGRWVWIAALAACAAGSLIVAIAPGNALRTMHFPKRRWAPARRTASGWECGMRCSGPSGRCFSARRSWPFPWPAGSSGAGMVAADYGPARGSGGYRQRGPGDRRVRAGLLWHRAHAAAAGP